MKLELSIKDDKELRNLIKDMIKGQVTSIIRDELSDMIKEAMEKKLGVSLKNLDTETILREEMRSHIKCVVYNYGNNYIQNTIKDAVNDMMTQLFKDRYSTPIG